MPLDACARRGGRVRERDVPCVAHNTTERERWSAHARQANEKNERCKRKARARMTGVHARDGKEKRATCTRDGLLHPPPLKNRLTPLSQGEAEEERWKSEGRAKDVGVDVDVDVDVDGTWCGCGCGCGRNEVWMWMWMWMWMWTELAVDVDGACCGAVRGACTPARPLAFTTPKASEPSRYADRLRVVGCERLPVCL